MNDANVLNKIQGSLLGTFIGDSFGLPFEAAHSMDLTESVELRSKTKGFWSYSDDTEMMIGIAESLIEKKGWDSEHCLRTMAQNYEPARGYGKGMKLAFRHVQNGGDWKEVSEVSWSGGSKGNGASSRIAPIACLYFDQEEELERALRESAELSHSHPLGITGAVMQGLSIAYVLRESEPEQFFYGELVSWLRKQPAVSQTIYAAKLDLIGDLLMNEHSREEAVSKLGNGFSAEDSAPLALYCFLNAQGDFRRSICDAALCCGDTDTICAMSGALAGAYRGFEGIPSEWLPNLEDVGKGRQYVMKLGESLHHLWTEKKETE